MIYGTWGNRVFVLLFVAVAVGLLVQTRRLEDTQDASATLALKADTLAATLDTTRRVNMPGVLADSLVAVQRRAVQAAQSVDSLDRALGLVRAGWAQFRTSVSALRAVTRSETVYVSASDSVRRATFDVRHEPYTVHAAVDAPPAPNQWTMDVRVELDTIAMEARVGCGSAGAEGVRPATLTVIGPAWADVKLGRVSQSPAVCSTADGAAATGTRRVLHEALGRFGISVGYGVTRQPSGSVVAGPTVVAGVRLWP